MSAGDVQEVAIYVSTFSRNDFRLIFDSLDCRSDLVALFSERCTLSTRRACVAPRTFLDGGNCLKST